MPHPPSGRVINYMSNIFYKLRNLLANRVTLVDDPAYAWWQYPEPGINPYWYVNRVISNSWHSRSEKDKEQIIKTYNKYRKLMDELDV